MKRNSDRVFVERKAKVSNRGKIKMELTCKVVPPDYSEKRMVIH